MSVPHDDVEPRLVHRAALRALERHIVQVVHVAPERAHALPAFWAPRAILLDDVPASTGVDKARSAVKIAGFIGVQVASLVEGHVAPAGPVIALVAAIQLQLCGDARMGMLLEQSPPAWTEPAMLDVLVRFSYSPGMHIADAQPDGAGIPTLLANVLERLAHRDLLRLLVESLAGEGDGNNTYLFVRPHHYTVPGYIYYLLTHQGVCHGAPVYQSRSP